MISGENFFRKSMPRFAVSTVCWWHDTGGMFHYDAQDCLGFTCVHGLGIWRNGQLIFVTGARDIDRT